MCKNNILLFRAAISSEVERMKNNIQMELGEINVTECKNKSIMKLVFQIFILAKNFYSC